MKTSLLTSSSAETILLFCLFICFIGLFAFLIFLFFDYTQVPFSYPEIKCIIDLSGKRQPSYEDYIDEWLIKLDGHGRTAAKMVNNIVHKWENDSKEYLRGTWFWKKHKSKIYMQIKQEVFSCNYEIFVFEFVRRQTRYKQRNYQKQAYKVKNTEFVIRLSLRQLLEIDDELEEIDYETTRQQYFSINQRRLLTKELRRKIIERDHYTCQICGKYMPDEVGLHVDHIIPIKKGGKSVESNLQVLCDKCNLRKGQN